MKKIVSYILLSTLTLATHQLSLAMETSEKVQSDILIERNKKIASILKINPEIQGLITYTIAHKEYEFLNTVLDDPDYKLTYFSINTTGELNKLLGIERVLKTFNSSMSGRRSVSSHYKAKKVDKIKQWIKEDRKDLLEILREEFLEVLNKNVGQPEESEAIELLNEYFKK